MYCEHTHFCYGETLKSDNQLLMCFKLSDCKNVKLAVYVFD